MQDMLTLVNNARTSNGLRPVCYNAKLNWAAQEQAATYAYGECAGQASLRGLAVHLKV